MLGERDKAIQDMKEEKDDLERSIEALQKALKQQEQSTGKLYKVSLTIHALISHCRQV